MPLPPAPALRVCAEGAGVLRHVLQVAENVQHRKLKRLLIMKGKSMSLFIILWAGLLAIVAAFAMLFADSERTDLSEVPDGAFYAEFVKRTELMEKVKLSATELQAQESNGSTAFIAKNCVVLSPALNGHSPTLHTLDSLVVDMRVSGNMGRWYNDNTKTSDELTKH